MSTTAVHSLPDLPLAMPVPAIDLDHDTSPPDDLHDSALVEAVDTRARLLPALRGTTPTPPHSFPAQSVAVSPHTIAPITVLTPALTMPLASLQPPTDTSTPGPDSPWAGLGHTPAGTAMVPPVSLPKRVPATLAQAETSSQPLPPPTTPQDILDARAQAKGQEALNEHVRVFLARRNLMIAGLTGAISTPLLSLTTAHYVGWGLLPLTVLSIATCLLIAQLRLGHLSAAVLHGLPGSFLIILLTHGNTLGIIAGMGIILSGTLLAVWLEERRSVGR